MHIEVIEVIVYNISVVFLRRSVYIFSSASQQLIWILIFTQIGIHVILYPQQPLKLDMASTKTESFSWDVKGGITGFLFCCYNTAVKDTNQLKLKLPYWQM